MARFNWCVVFRLFHGAILHQHIEKYFIYVKFCVGPDAANYARVKMNISKSWLRAISIHLFYVIHYKIKGLKIHFRI